MAVVGYPLYAFIRNTQGKAQSPAAYHRAVKDAAHVVSAERHLGMYHEKAVQHLALRVPVVTQGLDTFWSLAYLIGTLAVVVWLIRWQPNRYRRLRNAFILATATGLIIFAFFPAVPPRMLPQQFGFVDTWAQLGGIGMKNPPRIERISDPFASMPSLHVAWAVWCALAVAPACKRWWGKALAWSYATLTIVAVIATGNHFILDAINGTALAVGALMAVDLAARWWGRRAERRRDGDRSGLGAIGLGALGALDFDELDLLNPELVLADAGAAA